MKEFQLPKKAQVWCLCDSRVFSSLYVISLGWSKQLPWSLLSSAAASLYRLKYFLKWQEKNSNDSPNGLLWFCVKWLVKFSRSVVCETNDWSRSAQHIKICLNSDHSWIYWHSIFSLHYVFYRWVCNLWNNFLSY